MPSQPPRERYEDVHNAENSPRSGLIFVDTRHWSMQLTDEQEDEICLRVENKLRKQEN